MTLRVVGQHKGSITLDLDTATVLELKQAVARDSGLAVGGLKLLAGGKHLKDDSFILAHCGITPGKTIMVLRQDLSDQVQAEVGLNRRNEEVAQAASMLSARAARDIGTGPRSNAWGGWGRGRGRAAGRDERGTGGSARDHGPQIELTNQDGEAMAIPAEDSAALMEGMMLHRKGLACVARGRTASSTAATAAAVGAAPDAQHPRSSGTPNAPPTTERSGTENKKQEGQYGAAQGVEESKEGFPGSEQSGAEKGKGGVRQEESGAEEAQSVRAMEVDGDARESGSAGGATRKEEAAQEEVGAPKKAGAGETVMPGKDCGSGSPHVHRQSKSDDKGKGKLRSEAPVRYGERLRPASSASEKRLSQREALGLLMKAEEAFRRSDPKYLECVDNYAYLCLDIVWLLFLMKDMSNLDLASRMLESVEKGFQRAHGVGLQRLTALKGEYCAEKLLYVRLHLLQGVVAFLKGNSGKASGLLIRASEEAKALKPNPALASSLMQKWHTVKFEVLRPKLALRALRVGRNDLDAAWQYLESLYQRKDTVRKERERRRDQRRAERFGRTANKNTFVDAALVKQLADGGFPRSKAISALRQHNNDIETALTILTSGQAANANSGDNGNEALVVLHSMGVSPEAARDVLARTGTLSDALRELGIEGPEGMRAGGTKKTNNSSDGGKTGDAVGAEEEKSSSDGSRRERGSSEDDWGSEKEGERGSEPTPEEMKLYDELAADRANQDEDGYLDVTLEDEADAADMYLHLCRGNIPVAFDLDEVRAGIAAAATESGDTSTKT